MNLLLREKPMKSSVKKIKECKFKLSVEVEAVLVENRFQEVLRDFQRSARLPGFREGKAPLELIEKKFSNEAREEVLKSLIPEAYHWSLSNQKISSVSLPKISEIQMERGKKLTFCAEFERAPEFSLRHYKGIKIKKVPAEVDVNDLERALFLIQESKAELKPVTESRAVQKGDFVVSDVEVWENNQYAAARQGVLLAVEPNPNDDFCDKMVGAQMNEVREITSGGKPLCKVWVRGIQEKKLPSLNDDLARLFGKATLEELKEAVRKDVARQKNQDSFEKMKAELFQKLLALVSFDLPETLIEKQKEELLEHTRRHYERQRMPAGHWETEKPKLAEQALAKAKDQVRLYFILQKVAELEGIDVDEEALERKLQALAEESKRPEEEVRRVFEQDLRESMRESKTIEFLLANAKFDEKG
jgi:trigger factor